MKKIYIFIAISSMLFLSSAKGFLDAYSLQMIDPCESVEEVEADAKQVLLTSEHDSDHAQVFYIAKAHILPLLSRNFNCYAGIVSEFPSHTVLFFSRSFNHSPPLLLA